MADGTVEIMIEDARKLPTGAVITADICIVGGGAAGIAIAHELANSARRIVLLAGGDRRERGADRDLHRGEVAPGTSHEPLEEGRRRAWGGATLAWSGRCVPLDPIDLEPREWIPNSGWPIGYGELQPYLERGEPGLRGRTVSLRHARGVPAHADRDDRRIRRSRDADVAARALQSADELRPAVRAHARAPRRTSGFFSGRTWLRSTSPTTARASHGYGRRARRGAISP